jgi:hypothetical protein
MNVNEHDLEDQALADFDIGFQAALDGEPIDEAATEDWRRGYRDAALSVDSE